MSANFNPNLNTYSNSQPFRFWCQKVLPLVYDDSLSYYELLAKVVKYLNNMMSDLNLMESDIEALHTAYAQLETYVNEYFDSLDIQAEVNHKIDEMAENGFFDDILTPLFNEYTASVNSTVSAQNDAINVLKGRMDTFASLPNGSTTADAELIDIRVETDGTVAATAGDAVRAQITNLNSDLDNYLYGTTVVFSCVASRVNKFHLKMLEGQTYTVTNGTSGKIGVEIWRADGTKKTIFGNLASGASGNFVPDKQDYVTIGVWPNSAGNVTVTCPFSSFDKIDDLETDVLSVQQSINKVTTTEAIPANATQHKNQFYNVNNTFYEGNQWDYYTVPVTAGDTFTIDTAAGGTARGWAFRDSSDNQLSVASYNGDVVQKEYENVVAPDDATVLIVNFKHNSGYLTITQNGAFLINISKIYYNSLPLSDYLDRIGTNGNILYGKTLVCCGDSITYGADMDSQGIIETPSIDVYQYSAYTKKWTRQTSNVLMPYGYQIAARNGMTFYNGGVSGATVQGSGDDLSVPGFSAASGEYTLLPDNIDYLTLFYGWNDKAFGTLGTIDDTTNNSYYGGYNVTLPYLINKYPTAKIALIVPFGCDAQHREAIRLLANKWGVACWDNYQGGTPLYYGKEDSVGVESSIVTANRATYQANGAHPNYAGHYLLSTMIEQFLRGI